MHTTGHFFITFGSFLKKIFISTPIEASFYFMDPELTRLGAAGSGTEVILGPFQRGGLRGTSVVTMWCPLSTDIYGAEVGTEIHGAEHGTKFGTMCFGALGLGAECLCPLFEADDLGCGPKIKFIEHNLIYNFD